MDWRIGKEAWRMGKTTHVRAIDKIPPPAPAKACAMLSVCREAAEAAAARFCCTAVN